MSFEIVKVQRGRVGESLQQHQASLRRNGLALFDVGDLSAVGIEHKAVLLADLEGMRIGLRGPRNGEGAIAAKVVAPKGGKSKTPSSRRRLVNLTPALRQLAVEPVAVAGRYKLVTKDRGLLVIAFVDELPEDKRSRQV